MNEQLATLSDHLDALRKTLLQTLMIAAAGFFVLLLFYQPLIKFITAYSIEHSESGLLLIMGPLDGFVLVFRACFWLSLVATAPLWGAVWLRFALPALKPSERALMIPFILSSFLFLCMGLAFAHFVTLPTASHSLYLFNQSIGQNAWTLSSYVDYLLVILSGHAVAAEIALLLFFLVHFGVLRPGQLILMRRHMIVASFVLGALLTPPDIVTQFFLAVPLICLYELAIVYAKWRRVILHVHK